MNVPKQKENNIIRSINDKEVSFVMTALFNPLKIQDNLEGWGPCDTPENLKDLPYTPFSKSDRLGKVSYERHLNAYGV